MARVELPITVLDTAGAPVSGVSVTVSHRSNGSAAPWWPSETGGTSSTGPITTDTYGRTNAWVERGAYNCTYTLTPYGTVTESFDASPAGNGTIDRDWLSASILPSGLILPYGGSATPDAAIWLLCNGNPVSRTTYAALFNVIGTFYGAGDGSTTFNLPDLQGRTLVGQGTHTDVDTRGKTESGAIANAQLAVSLRRVKHKHSKGTLAISASGSHNHTVTDPGHSHVPSNNYAFLTTNQTGGLAGDGGAQPYWPPNQHVWGTNTATTGISVNSNTHAHGNADFTGVVGESTADNLLQDQIPFQVVNFLIKV